jgi:predicted nucleotidyltransferase
VTINDEIITIKNLILENADCEQIYLFGSYAFGSPGPDSDYDFYVVLNNSSKKPILVMEDIQCILGKTGIMMPVDIIAQYKTRFDERSKLPAMEQEIVKEGTLLYDKHGVS